VTLNDTVGSTTETLTTLNLGSKGLASFTYTPVSGGTHTITANYTPDNVVNFATSSASTSFAVMQPQGSFSWQPSTLEIFSGAALGSGVLDATYSVGGSTNSAVITYSYLSSGTSTTVTAATVLPAGGYVLQAQVKPENLAYATQTLQIPFTVQNMNVFVANANGTTASLYNNGTVASSAVAGGGIGAAVDSSGSVWSINTNGNGVSKFTDAGALSGSYTGVAGISAATALTVDGNGTVWIANGGGSVSALTPSGTAAETVPIGSAANLSNPASISIDPTGSLWIANSGNNTVTEIIGVAAPVTTPLAQSVVNNTVAARP
jgi:hypothetical protein